MNKDILKVENIFGGYHRNKNVVHGISLDIASGSFVGIIGPNGCGKSTLLRLASRALKPISGKAQFDGQDVHSLGFKEFFRNVAVVSQDIHLDMVFNVYETVAMGRIPHLSRLQPQSTQDIAIITEAIKVTGVEHLKGKYLNELSSGERQRVMLAIALAQAPRLLLLDEPTSHLDIGHQIQILDLLKRLNKEKNITIVIILHDLNLAAEYCDRIILMDEGRVFKDGTIGEVLTYENIEAVYKTVVVVRENPISKKPHVMLVPGEICKHA
jgi:iron complex transport system ATP-binding protein